MQYIKYRTEFFDDYFPCRKGKERKGVNYNISEIGSTYLLTIIIRDW
jgi:hypothetical protein